MNIGIKVVGAEGILGTLLSPSKVKDEKSEGMKIIFEKFTKLGYFF
jgi:hypothetical protein